MKNQTDLIVSIVAIVFGIIGVIVCFTQKPTVTAPPAPTAVNLSQPKLPEAQVVYATSLPGGGGQGAAAGGFPGFGGPGGPGGPGGGRAPRPGFAGVGGGGGPMAAGAAGGRP